MVLEDQREGKGLKESGIHKWTTLLIKSLNILCELWLLLLRALHIVKEVFVQEVESTACRLINLEHVVRKTTVDKGEDFLNHLEVKLHKHQL